MDNPPCRPASGAAGKRASPCRAPLSGHGHTWRPAPRGTSRTVCIGTHPPASGPPPLTAPRAAGPLIAATPATASGGPAAAAPLLARPRRATLLWLPPTTGSPKGHAPHPRAASRSQGSSRWPACCAYVRGPPSTAPRPAIPVGGRPPSPWTPRQVPHGRPLLQPRLLARHRLLGSGPPIRAWHDSAGCPAPCAGPAAWTPALGAAALFGPAPPRTTGEPSQQADHVQGAP